VVDAISNCLILGSSSDGPAPKCGSGQTSPGLGFQDNKQFTGALNQQLTKSSPDFLADSLNVFPAWSGTALPYQSPFPNFANETVCREPAPFQRKSGHSHGNKLRDEARESLSEWEYGQNHIFEGEMNANVSAYGINNSPLC
jgi:hypothetical protein